MDLKDDYKVDTLMRTKNFEYGGMVSPDGKWFVYGSNESGILQIYMKTFPDLQGKWQISTNGGSSPSWTPSGDKIYYLDLQYKILSVALQRKPSVVIGNPKILFNAINGYLPSTPTNNYDITPDGKKIIMLFKGDQKKSQFDINVVTNWKKELKEKLGQ